LKSPITDREFLRVQPHIFEPFFTTKELAKAFGLGPTRSAYREAQGSIRDLKPGDTVQVWLPGGV
jgi:C4-dicarboxylate-specific signal transduction histidine kinase